MPRRISRRTLASFEEVPSIVRLWMYRLVLNLQGHRILLTPHGFSNDGVAHALGLSPWVNERREFDAELILQDLRARQAVLERRSARPEAPPAMVRNVQALADLIDLNPVECRVLEFVCLLHSSRVLDDCADLLGMVTHARLADILAELLGLPASGIRWALSPQSQLTQSELVSVNRTGADRLQCKFSLLCNTLSEAIQMPGASVADLFRYVAQPAAPSALSLGDFEHIQAQTSVLIPYLQYCLQKRSTGVNIMIHGLPGVGKTELARLLAHTLGCTLFEVVSQDADGSPQPGQIRLRSLKAAQRIYRKSQALVLFDEAEDVFASDIMTPSVAGKRKAWVNSLLEDAPTPTLWLSNSIDDLDPAFARRFDMIFEMPVPPRSRREQLLAHACGSLVDARTTVRLAQLPHLAPAVAARAASVVRAVGGQLQQHTPTQAFEMLVRNTLQAQGHALPAPAGGTQELPEHYDPAFIHADADLQQVLAGLRQAQSARLCLWGPPGTGKSAYGRWLAQALDRPLVVQRGSDLMSKYVGESEKRIARAFRQAANDGAVLMIDEVDGFLRDRQTVGQSWEVSQVNEMLTQMESYEGVFVASTNLMDALDPAAMRRFDLKVKLDYLRPEQVQALFDRCCQSLGLAALPAPDQARLARLNRLTPGDFALLMRQHRFKPLRDALALLKGLEAECQYKGGSTGTYGFL